MSIIATRISPSRALAPLARSALALAWIAAPASAVEPAEAIDLPQAIRYALAGNKELARAAYSVQANSVEVDRARADFKLSARPAAGFDYGAGAASPAYGLTLLEKTPLGTSLGVGGEVFTEGGNQRLVNVQLEQPILRNFGRLISLEPTTQALSGLARSRRRVAMQKEELTLEVVKAYEGILTLTEHVRADEESSRRMDSLQELTEAKEALGRATRNDTLRVRFLRGQAGLRLESARERLFSTQRDFAELLGFPPEKAFDLKPTAPVQLAVPEPEEAVRMALDNRLQYAQALQDREDADRGARIGRRRLLPDLKLLARKQWSQAPLSTSFGVADDRMWYLGLALQSDLNLAADKASFKRTQVDRASARESVSIVERSIARQVRQQLQAYRRALAEEEIAKRNYDLSEARVAVARELFRLGRGDSFSAAETEDALVQSKNQLYSTRADAILASYRLSDALGTLSDTPQELKPGGRLSP